MALLMLVVRQVLTCQSISIFYFSYFILVVYKYLIVIMNENKYLKTEGE